jgi:hypothetical protein
MLQYFRTALSGHAEGYQESAPSAKLQRKTLDCSLASANQQPKASRREPPRPKRDMPVVVFSGVDDANDSATTGAAHLIKMQVYKCFFNGCVIACIQILF